MNTNLSRAKSFVLRVNTFIRESRLFAVDSYYFPQAAQTSGRFELSAFGIRISFGFRDSNFGFCGSAAPCPFVVQPAFHDEAQRKL
jgi:hypothetical protein